MPNNVDLINDPIRRAQELAQEQLDSFRKNVMPEQQNPVKEYLRSQGIRLKDLQASRRNTQRIRSS